MKMDMETMSRKAPSKKDCGLSHPEAAVYMLEKSARITDSQVQSMYLDWSIGLILITNDS